MLCLNVKYFFQPFEVLTADKVCTYPEKTYKKANPIQMTAYAKINPPNFLFDTHFRINFDSKCQIIPQNLINCNYMAKIYGFKGISYFWEYLPIGERYWKVVFFPMLAKLCQIFYLPKVVQKSKSPNLINFWPQKCKYIRSQNNYGLSVFCNW